MSIVAMLSCLVPMNGQIVPHHGQSVDLSHGRLMVSENKRFLQFQDGTPFFYLGDTGWELFHRLTYDEAEKYLENRRQKGFTVIQAVILAELDGLNTPNRNGERPFINNDPTKPNEKYFLFVEIQVFQLLYFLKNIYKYLYCLYNKLCFLIYHYNPYK